MDENYRPIGHMATCFSEKFGTPRQSMMVKEARGVLKLRNEPRFLEAVDQLDSFSHVWVIFVFHEHRDLPWKSKITTPRVEANRVGVFASRSPHRPNPIGMSVLKLEKIDRHAAGGIEIHFSGVDLLDRTPVLDIKPYLPYADSVADANSGWATEEIHRYQVSFSPESLSTLQERKNEDPPRFRELLTEMLALDPRPISQRRSMPLSHPDTQGAVFRFRISSYDVEWQVTNGAIHVVRLLLC